MRLRTRVAVLTLAGLLSLTSCKAVWKWFKEEGLPIAGSLLQAAAANYSPGYAQGIGSLLDLLMTPFAEADSASESLPDPAVMEVAASELRLDVALIQSTYRDGAWKTDAIEDGVTLHDRGDPARSDRFKVHFRVNEPCWVYVINIDGSGWVKSLFPFDASGARDPVAADRENVIPPGEDFFGLDELKGVETLYFLVSRERRTDVEQQLDALEEEDRAQLTDPRRVEEPHLLSRGVRDVRRGRSTIVQTRDGAVQVEPIQFLTGADDLDLVVTRWFRHE